MFLFLCFPLQVEQLYNDQLLFSFYSPAFSMFIQEAISELPFASVWKRV